MPPKRVEWKVPQGAVAELGDQEEKVNSLHTDVNARKYIKETFGHTKSATSATVVFPSDQALINFLSGIFASKIKPLIYDHQVLPDGKISCIVNWHVSRKMSQIYPALTGYGGTEIKIREYKKKKYEEEGKMEVENENLENKDIKADIKAKVRKEILQALNGGSDLFWVMDNVDGAQEEIADRFGYYSFLEQQAKFQFEQKMRERIQKRIRDGESLKAIVDSETDARASLFLNSKLIELASYAATFREIFATPPKVGEDRIGRGKAHASKDRSRNKEKFFEKQDSPKNVSGRTRSSLKKKENKEQNEMEEEKTEQEKSSEPKKEEKTEPEKSSDPKAKRDGRKKEQERNLEPRKEEKTEPEKGSDPKAKKGEKKKEQERISEVLRVKKEEAKKKEQERKSSEARQKKEERTKAQERNAEKSVDSRPKVEKKKSSAKSVSGATVEEQELYDSLLGRGKRNKIVSNSQRLPQTSKPPPWI